ncbi:MAG TPA: ATP-binding protein [Terriglobales bacterium]|nr:ATP-binding protein [Terriglobales bacterium]
MQRTRPPVKQQHLSREFVITGNVAALGPARDAIMDFVRQHCTGEQQEIDVMVAVQEALANAILHGCRNDAAKLVHCTVEISPSAIEFTIRDPGPGFDSGGVTDAIEDGTNLTQHGRGICLIRGVMDELTYRHNGAELYMKKEIVGKSE